MRPRSAVRLSDIELVCNLFPADVGGWKMLPRNEHYLQWIVLRSVLQRTPAFQQCFLTAVQEQLRGETHVPLLRWVPRKRAQLLRTCLFVGGEEQPSVQPLTMEEFAELVDRIAENQCLGATATSEFVAFVSAVRRTGEVPNAKTRKKVSNAALRASQLFRGSCFTDGHRPNITAPLQLKTERELCALYLAMRAPR
eukprot:ANDGO_07360.mRNA.1 hypothetical protein